MPILAIDQGTSSTKAVVVADDGTVLALAEAEVRVTATADHRVEVRPEDLWNSVVVAGTEALNAAGQPRLDAIGLANQGETVLAWDRNTGEPIGNAIVWQDRRATDICGSLRPVGERLREITGLELDAYFTGPKLAWLDRHGADMNRSKTALTTTDTWLLHRLCGAFVTDVATAGRSLLTDLRTGAWSEEACAYFELDPTTFPRVVENTETVGVTTVFGQEVPITGLCVDQQAALYAQRCRTLGEAKCTYGTGAFMLACTGDLPVVPTTGLVGCPAWAIDGRIQWCLDGQVYTAGSAVSWLISVGVMSNPSDLDALGGLVPDSGGVTFVPALAGLAAPYWDSHATATFAGMSLATERGHLVRAAIDGIAVQIALLCRSAAIDLGSPLRTLRVDGGLTRSATLMQTQADLAQLRIEQFASPHATALGVAEFAALGAGLAGFLPPAQAESFEPRITADEAAERITAWQTVAEMTLQT
jgi:glycerol kinase